jgi:hypothetical protein
MMINSINNAVNIIECFSVENSEMAYLKFRPYYR